MTVSNQDKILREAQEISDADARRAFLSQACNGDEDLLKRVEAAIDAGESGSLRQTPAGMVATIRN